MAESLFLLLSSLPEPASLPPAELSGPRSWLEAVRKGWKVLKVMGWSPLRTVLLLALDTLSACSTG